MNNIQGIHISDKSAEYSAAGTGSRINEHFVSTASDLPRLDLSGLPAYLPALSSVPTISPLEVYGKLKKVKLHKSGGPDLIPSWLMGEFPTNFVFSCQTFSIVH